MVIKLRISRSLIHLLKALAAILPLALSVGCSDGEEQARRGAAEDAKAIAAVEAAQKVLPPTDFVTLQPITESDREPCTFNFPASAKPPVFRFGPDAGVVVIDGNVKTFAADHGSIEVYPGVRQEYDGKEFSLQIQIDVDDPANRGNAQYWPAKITMSDRYERPVFHGVGLVTCNAAAKAPVALGSAVPPPD